MEETVDSDRFGKGYFNGFGGKVEEGETIDAAAVREVPLLLHELVFDQISAFGNGFR